MREIVARSLWKTRSFGTDDDDNDGGDDGAIIISRINRRVKAAFVGFCSRARPVHSGPGQVEMRFERTVMGLEPHQLFF